MRRAFLTIVLLLMASAAFAGDARVRVTLKPEVVDVEAAARELAETYAAKVVAIEGNNVVVELSIARSGLVARDPHVAAVTVLGSATAAPLAQRSYAAPASRPAPACLAHQLVGEETMIRSFDDNSLRKRLARLSPSARLAFAAACGERLLPNYRAFVKSASWGDPALLREALDYVWSSINAGTVDRNRVQELLSGCERAVPDSESFSSDWTSAAIDAGTAVIEALEALLDGSMEHIVNTAIFCRDTVDMFIQIRDRLDFNSDPNFESKISENPLMQQELARQARVLDELDGRPSLDASFVDQLKKISQDGALEDGEDSI